MSMILYVDAHYVSPYAFSCWVALKEKQLPFEARPLQIATQDHHDPIYRQRSLTGRIPAFAHDDFWLSESSAIVEYLDELFPSPHLMPKESKQRARARQVMAWIRSDLMALREERPSATMFYTRPTKPLSEKGEAAANNLLRVASTLIADGKNQLFDDWSIADADLAFVLHRLIANGYDVPEKIRHFATTQWQRQSIRSWVEQARIEYQPY